MARIPADLSRRIPRGSRRTRIGVLVGIVILIILLLSLRGIAGFYTDFLWFNQLGLSSVFSGILFTRVLLAVAFVAVFFVLLFANLLIADRIAPVLLPTGQVDELVTRYRQVVGPRGRWVRLVTAVIFALFAGVGTQSQWNNWILFRYHVNFNAVDPEFHRNVAFYVFDLPFIKFLLGWFFGAIVVCLLVTAVAHYLNGGLRFSGPSPRTSGAAKAHLSVLMGILALIQAVGYYYQRLELVLSTDHVVAGATATSVHADKPADTLLIGIAVIAAALFLFNIRQRGWTLPIVAIGLWFLVWLLVGHVYPALYQALRVNHSELTKEAPYIQRNITATRAAYGLNDVQVNQNFDATQTVTAAQVTGSTPQAAANQSTITNVRLLDPAQLLNTFDRYQALRTFYSFNSLEFDRYNLSTAGNPPTETATIASVRELNNQVPSGFVNQILTYTNGYGAVVAPAGEAGVDDDGNPSFTLSDVPPTGSPNLTEQGSQVYFGEGSAVNGYVVADSKQAELDYEDQAGNEVSTHYAGKGGVKLGGFLNRVAFALRFGDANLVLSGQIDGSSRIMYIRNIQSRVQKAAPFLKYDSDPYPVVLNGAVYWVIDAYTVTNNYPYAQTADNDGVPVGAGLSGTFDYVRNSVKVVINAYTGAMHFFVMDNDPIIETY
ncbi:MAG: UPF0182 family protein, partial [Acidimicrobiales bacterium]